MCCNFRKRGKQIMNEFTLESIRIVCNAVILIAAYVFMYKMNRKDDKDDKK